MNWRSLMATTRENGSVASTNNVSITTLSVNIRVVQMNEKQTTLAKFKQFHEAPLINDDLTLNGLIWGYVNYYWDDMDRDHRHFVFQMGEGEDEELYRDLVDLRPSKDFYYGSGDNQAGVNGYQRIARRVENAFLHVYATSLIEGNLPKANDKGEVSWSVYHRVPGTPFSTGIHPGRGDFNVPEYRLESLRSDSKFKYYSPEQREGWKKEALKNLSEIQEVYGDDCDFKTSWGRLMVVSKELKDYCDKWDQLLVELRKAKHLFIAV
jgi:hypothetical protein